MKILAVDELGVAITLSRRNLETLLAKLDGHPEGSACSIMKHQTVNGEEMTLWIHAEDNDEHYESSGGFAGRMHPDTEERI